jgi:hypothetical protein
MMEHEPGQLAYETAMASLAKDDQHLSSPRWVSRGATERRAWAAAEATVEARVRAPYEQLLTAARAVLCASENKHPDITREEAESRAFRWLHTAISAFPHPCAARALTPSTSLPETAGEKEDSNE